MRFVFNGAEDLRPLVKNYSDDEMRPLLEGLPHRTEAEAVHFQVAAEQQLLDRAAERRIHRADRARDRFVLREIPIQQADNNRVRLDIRDLVITRYLDIHHRLQRTRMGSLAS